MEEEENKTNEEEASGERLKLWRRRRQFKNEEMEDEEGMTKIKEEGLKT